MCCHPRLYKAAESGNKEAVIKCITDGHDIDCRIEGLLSTPLLTATYEGHIEVVYILVQQHCNIDAKDTVGRTALSWLSLRGNNPAVSFLIKHGADIHNSDHEGETPLLAAVRSGHLDTVMLLIQSGANIDDRDNMGQTALMCAATDGRMSIFQALLDHGAKWNASDNLGRTILDRFEYNIDHRAVVQATYMSFMHKCVPLLNVKGKSMQNVLSYRYGHHRYQNMLESNEHRKSVGADLTCVQYDHIYKDLTNVSQKLNLECVIPDEQIVHKTYQGSDNYNVTPVAGDHTTLQMTFTLSDISHVESLMKYICQIDYPSGLATGFVYDFINIESENKMTCLILTSHHLLVDNVRNGIVHKGLKSGISESYVLFNHHGCRGKSVPAQYKIKGVYLENSELDYALIYLENNQLLASSFNNSGLQKYINSNSSLSDNERLTLIGHSMGHVMQADILRIYDKSDVIKLVQSKQNVSRPAYVMDVNTNINWNMGHNLHYLQPHCPKWFIFYTCNSYHGSSGAPCFQFSGNDVKLICIQKAGIYASSRSPKPGEHCDFGVGVLAMFIKRDIEEKLGTVKCKS